MCERKMSDIVVTMPLAFQYGDLKGLDAWISEGDAAGDPDTGCKYCFSVGGYKPTIRPGERVYIVHNKHLIGYASLVRLDTLEVQSFGKGSSHPPWGHWGLIRAGGAVAVTIAEEIPGFRGWRYRWWERNDERPFPDWKAVAVPQKFAAKKPEPKLF